MALAAITLAAPAAGQFQGPPTWTSIGGHQLAPPASVTSVAGPHAPPILPSVTSIPNNAYRSHGYAPYSGIHHRGQGGYGYGYGYGGYVMPYYIPLDTYGYDYVGSYAGGPDVYSGPPVTPPQTLHIIVEQPPAVRYEREPEEEQSAIATPPKPAAAPPAPAAEATPNEPTVLVFRDGHKQEVSNYAIMGQTVWVFDKRTQKIALADLDLPATIKANDDRGMSFAVPPLKSAPQKARELQPKSTPAQPSQPAPHVV